MKRFLILWVVACLVVVLLLEKIVEKEVVKTVEVPVFKGEKIIEKVVYYQPSPVGIFVIEKISDDEWTVEIRNPSWGNEADVEFGKDRIHFRRKISAVSQHGGYNPGTWR